MDLYDGEIKKLTSMLENHGAKRLPLQRVWEMTDKEMHAALRAVEFSKKDI